MTTTTGPSERWRKLSLAIGVISGGFFVVSGSWAMVAPRSFFDAAATFDPYNQHFIQDIGAFQIGLGAVLLLSAVLAGDSLTVALLGVGVGAGAHLVSHIVGRDLGGKPETDIPTFALVTVLLVGAGVMRLRDLRR